jgi:hypothetical protein
MPNYEAPNYVFFTTCTISSLLRPSILLSYRFLRTKAIGKNRPKSISNKDFTANNFHKIFSVYKLYKFHKRAYFSKITALMMVEKVVPEISLIFNEQTRPVATEYSETLCSHLKNSKLKIQRL